MIKVNITKGELGDWFYAHSDDLRGLLVTGRSEEEVKNQIPLSIKELYDAIGKTDIVEYEIIPK